LTSPVLESELPLSGNGAAWLEQKDLLPRFRELLSGVPIVALLRSGDALFAEADSNCLADNQLLWGQIVIQPLQKRNIFTEKKSFVTPVTWGA